jgi:hypothetical protein
MSVRRIRMHLVVIATTLLLFTQAAIPPKMLGHVDLRPASALP